MRRLIVASAGIAFLLGGMVQAIDARTHSGQDSARPQQYYLALGDSIAYGIQPGKVEKGLPPSGFHTGYVDVFAARLRAIAPKLRVVNYGCPGETTRTFISGGCPWLAEHRRLHDPFKGTQLDAALGFLRAHPGQVSPITITLFGNDVAELTDACKDDLRCIRRRAPRAIGQFASRLTTILGRLRSAAPRAEIIVTGGWNFNVENVKDTDPFFKSVDAAMARVSRGAQARFARLFPIFDAGATRARRRATLCRLTFICSGDPHPTDAGYRAIANAVFAASGY